MVDVFGEEPVFRVDMNRMRDGLRITVLSTHAKSFPVIPQVEAGQWVKIVDEDDNIASALVDRVESAAARPERLHLKVDMESWQLGAKVHLTPSWTPAVLDATKLGRL